MSNADLVSSRPYALGERTTGQQNWLNAYK